MSEKRISRYAAKKWLRENKVQLLWELGLEDWDVHFFCRSLESAVVGYCHPSPEYKIAKIEYDVCKIEHLEEFRSIITHELLHTVASPTEFFRRIVHKLLTGDEAKIETAEESWRQSSEQLILALEKMHRRLKDAQRG